MLSIASLSISSLLKLGDKANKCNDIKHDLYEAAVLTVFNCTTAVRSFDSMTVSS